MITAKSSPSRTVGEPERQLTWTSSASGQVRLLSSEYLEGEERSRFHVIGNFVYLYSFILTYFIVCSRRHENVISDNFDMRVTMIHDAGHKLYGHAGLQRVRGGGLGIQDSLGP